MLSLAPELERLRPLLGDALTDALVARDRREVFSVYPELRILGWSGAMLLATAAGIVLKNNYERIGPLAIALLIAAAAAGCYGWVWTRRARASVVDDFVLLLGALLVSADVAFVETQFHLLGDAWHRHFAIVAVFHGVGAYLFGSRTLLSLSITALAAWMGIRSGTPPPDGASFAMRAFATAALVVMWRVADARLRLNMTVQPREDGDGARSWLNIHVQPQRPASETIENPFTAVFDHFAANLILSGCLGLTFDDDFRPLGTLLTVGLAAVVMRWGFRTRSEAFVLYAFVYAVVAVMVFLLDVVANNEARLLIMALGMIGAIVALFFIHSRFREKTS